MEDRKLKIAILGLGGVGGYFAAKLARGYASSKEVEIIFLARERNADVIRRKGLALITPTEEFVAHPHAITSDGISTGPVDFLICAVKSYDLEESLKQFCACVGPETIILPLQNGIDAVARTREIFPENEVWSGCVYIVSRLVEPGVIRETGNIHILHFGSGFVKSDRLTCLHDIMQSVHPETYLHENIREVLWEKFIFISVVAGLTSYLDVCIGKILDYSANKKLLMGMLDEITHVALAEKILLREDIIPATVGKMQKLPYDTTSSMHSDFLAGHATEVQSLVGHVVELAQRHSIAVPVYNNILTGLLLRQCN
jgi:2-dehydropantoate 2-reductase